MGGRGEGGPPQVHISRIVGKGFFLVNKVFDALYRRVQDARRPPTPMQPPQEASSISWPQVSSALARPTPSFIFISSRHIWRSLKTCLLIVH